MLFLFFSLETSLLLRFLNFSLPTKKITLYSSKYSPKASNTLSPQKSSSNHCFIIINQVGYISNTSVMCYIFCNYGVKSFLKQLKEVYLFSLPYFLFTPTLLFNIFAHSWYYTYFIISLSYYYLNMLCFSLYYHSMLSSTLYPYITTYVHTIMSYIPYITTLYIRYIISTILYYYITYTIYIYTTLYIIYIRYIISTILYYTITLYIYIFTHNLKPVIWGFDFVLSRWRDLG